MAKRNSMHRVMTNTPLGYFITMRTYGTWLHGDERGSVDKHHNTYGTPVIDAQERRQEFVAGKMGDEPMLLATDSARVVERTIEEVCQHRGWKLRVVHARTNHVHVVVSAQVSPERVMNDFKAWATRRLREAGYVREGQNVWAA